MKAIKTFVSGFFNLQNTNENNEQNPDTTENGDSSVNIHKSDCNDYNMNINFNVSISSDDSDLNLNADINDIAVHETDNTIDSEFRQDTEEVVKKSILNVNEDVIGTVHDKVPTNLEDGGGLFNTINNNDNLLPEELNNYIDSNLMDVQNDVINLGDFEDLFENIDDNTVENKPNNTKVLVGDNEIKFSLSPNEPILISSDSSIENVVDVQNDVINLDDFEDLFENIDDNTVENKLNNTKVLVGDNEIKFSLSPNEPILISSDSSIENVVDVQNDVINLDDFEDLFENIHDNTVKNNTKVLVGHHEINFSLSPNEQILISSDLSKQNVVDVQKDVIKCDNFEDLFENIDDNTVGTKPNNTKVLVDNEKNVSLSPNEPIIIFSDLSKQNVTEIDKTLQSESEEKENETKTKMSFDDVIFIREFEGISFKTLKAVIPILTAKNCDANTNVDHNSNQNNVSPKTEEATLPITNTYTSNVINRKQNKKTCLRAFRKMKQPKNTQKVCVKIENNIKTRFKKESITDPNNNNTLKYEFSQKCPKKEDIDNSIISISSTKDNDNVRLLSSQVEETNTNLIEIDNNFEKPNEESVCSMAKTDKTINSCSEESDADGYNSSDFEFITQSEAEKDGFIIDYTHRDVKPKAAKSVKTEVYTEEISRERLSSVSSQEDLEKAATSNRPDNYYRDHYIQEIHERNAREQRQNHVVPEEDNYLNLFRGVHVPVLGDVMLLENKSLNIVTSMNSGYEGVGFDMMRVVESENEEYKDEAAETARKILCMYPLENRKRRSRF